MSEKYKTEIEEILRQAGELAPPERDPVRRPSVWRLIRLHINQSLGGKTWPPSGGRVMLAAVVLILLGGLILRPFAGGLGSLLAFAGLILFIVGYGMFFIRPPKVEKRWRGQLIDEGDSWWDRWRGKLK